MQGVQLWSWISLRHCLSSGRFVWGKTETYRRSENQESRKEKNQEVLIISADCSSTSIILAWYKMIFLPIVKTERLVMAQHAITQVIGNAVRFCSKLTNAEVSAPIPIWIAPIKADAVPALWLKGASESAEEFGKVNPWQHKKIKIINMVLNKSAHPTKVVTKRMSPVMLWHINAALIICSLW